jgi:hypothetical protein
LAQTGQPLCSQQFLLLAEEVAQEEQPLKQPRLEVLVVAAVIKAPVPQEHLGKGMLEAVQAYLIKHQVAAVALVKLE